eukprot:6178339-Pleurochrysis_carterae.AAC.3
MEAAVLQSLVLRPREEHQKTPLNTRASYKPGAIFVRRSLPYFAGGYTGGTEKAKQSLSMGWADHVHKSLEEAWAARVTYAKTATPRQAEPSLATPQ